MLALLYLIIMVMLGDALCRRIYRNNWLPFRWASAFLVGLIISTWTTYVIARVFAQTSKPLVWGNLLFLILAAGALHWLRTRLPIKNPEDSNQEFETSNKWDVVTIGLFVIFSCWMMFSSFNMAAGKLQIANHQWSDFGPNVAIMQSFALGHNFPTEYPHFSGDRIRYHFLFYFQAGNLEYLGLNPAWSNNLLSVLSLVSMLVLVIALGEMVFRSRAVGRLGAALFFFHGSLNYFSYIRGRGSLSKALSEAVQLKAFLPSGFPYRGEDWGVWSLVNFVNQRHFASAIGILILVIIFVIHSYRTAPEEEGQESWTQIIKRSYGYIFQGFLIGLLPLWNGAVFIAGAAVLGTLFLLFPLKRQMLVLAITAGIVALPQIVYLKTGNVHAAGYSLFHWGYTVNNPTPLNTLKYLGWTFGFKWLAIAIALLLAISFQRRIMLAISSLVAIAFLFQFSEEVLANHKFLNIWLIVVNLFVAFGVWQLWTRVIKGNRLIGKVAAAALLLLIAAGGVIDLFPIRNSHWVEIPFDGDRLVQWARKETDPQAVFLTDRFVTHRLLLAGRQIFHGWPYYTWGAGYLATQRDEVYKRLFEERDPQRLLTLLHNNNISYVAIDAGVRNGGFIKNLNETVYERNFEKVFQDTDNQYDGLSIFKVPAKGQPFVASAPVKTDNNTPATGNAFEGGTGKAPAQFDKPRGLTVDAEGNIYVADGGNSRVQKFSSQGDFLAIFGKTGTAEGELSDPNGVAVDSLGVLYVTDSANNRIVKFKADGTFLKHWMGPEPGFYGPRDISLGPDDCLYVLDQGRSRIVKTNKDGETLREWGRNGSGAGELNSPTGLAVAGERVYVADAGNNRIQIFDLEGTFIAQWAIPRWEKYLWHFPDVAVDEQSRRIYVTSGWTNEVLVLDLNGNLLETIKSESDKEFRNISSIAVARLKKSGNRLCILNTGTYAVEAGPPRVSMIERSQQSN